MRKINDTMLLELADKGTPQKEIAVLMGVTEAAISKRLKRLRQIRNRPAILDKLTEKEQKFVVAIVEGKSQTDAAAGAFEVTSRDSAKTLGCRLTKDPEIQEAITAVMETEGLTKRYLVRSLKTHVDSMDPTISLSATKEALKIHDVYPAQKRANINVDLNVTDEEVSRWFNR